MAIKRQTNTRKSCSVARDCSLTPFGNGAFRPSASERSRGAFSSKDLAGELIPPRASSRWVSAGLLRTVLRLERTEGRRGNATRLRRRQHPSLVQERRKDYRLRPSTERIPVPDPRL